MRACALVLLVAATTAHADNQSDANDLFRKGQAKYVAGEYREAIRLFDDAFNLVRDPVYLFNIAQAYRKLFDCIPASAYFTRYLTEATDADNKQRATVEQYLRELAPCVVERKAAAMQKPSGEDLQPPPPPPPAPKPTPTPPGFGLRLGGIAAASVGAIGLVIGTVYGRRGNSLEAELADCNVGCDWTIEREATDRAGRRANAIATIGWIAGGAALATGATLYIIGHSKRRRFERLTVTASPTGVGARVRF